MSVRTEWKRKWQQHCISSQSAAVHVGRQHERVLGDPAHHGHCLELPSCGLREEEFKYCCPATARARFWHSLFLPCHVLPRVETRDSICCEKGATVLIRLLLLLLLPISSKLIPKTLSSNCLGKSRLMSTPRALRRALLPARLNTLQAGSRQETNPHKSCFIMKC